MNTYKSALIRKEQSIEKLKLYGVDYIEDLPVTYTVSEVKMKGLEKIARRYIANIIAIQVAFDILEENDFEESVSFFSDLLDKYGVKEDLFSNEIAIFEGAATKEECVNLTWQYESINVLSWILGLNDKLEYPNNMCNTEKLISFVVRCENLESFIKKCKLIDIENILDELDLEYRYHWALVDNRINPTTNCGGLDEEIVVERRRALEWVFSDENDWNYFSLDT